MQANPRRRWLNTLLLALFLGAATTILLAWTFGIFAFESTAKPIVAADVPIPGDLAMERRGTSATPIQGTVRLILKETLGHTALIARLPERKTLGYSTVNGTIRTYELTHDHELLSERLLLRVDREMLRAAFGVRESSQIAQFSFGWPCRALKCSADGSFLHSSDSLAFVHNDWTGGTSLPRPERPWVPLLDEPVLALQPVWTGVALDTGFWGACWFLLLAISGRLRRELRARRACCAECGYLLLGNITGVCSECGAPGPTGAQLVGREWRAKLHRSQMLQLWTVGLVCGLVIAAWMVWPPERPIGTFEGAIERGSYDEIRSHLYWGADPKATIGGQSPLHLLFKQDPSTRARIDNPRLVALLLSYGADLSQRDSDGATALHLAAKAACPNSVRELLRHGANVNLTMFGGFTPLHLAAERSDNPAERLEVVRALVDAGAQIEALSRGDSSPLDWAVAAGDIGVVEFLLELGADASARPGNGGNLLHKAVERGLSQDAPARLVGLLIANGAELNGLDNHGRTALHLACSRWHSVPWVDELLARHMNPNVQDDSGDTPLVYALRYAWSDIEMVRRLLRGGARVDIRNSKGETPLHVVIEASDWRIDSVARLFVEHGADPNAKNANGETPLQQLARRLTISDDERRYLSALLIQLGAIPDPPADPQNDSD